MTVTSEGTLDTTPLTVCSTRPEMRQFTARFLGHRSRWNVGVGLIVLYAVTTAVVAALVFAALALYALSADAPEDPLRGRALLLSIGTAACLVAAVFSWVAHVRRGEREELFRLHRFAAANGLDFTPEVREPDLPGLVFQRGTLRRASARLRRSGPRPLEVANHRAWIQKGRAGESLHWSYFALTLGRRMPRIVLEARSGGRRLGSSLPAQPATGRALLGGPFADTFRLHCPAEAEGWAGALFTPEIVARFVGPGQTVFDVEVVEDRLFVYSHVRLLSCADPRTWRWMSETADALYARLAELDDSAVAADSGPAGGADVSAEGLIGLAPPYAPLRRPFPAVVLVPLLLLVGVWVVAFAG
ncbi:hypothetical protein ACFQO7_06765 [Catellatospora aurea]|uniref:DUF3137 domain-containing protein n=1 Tax=Catellatospora aurea TaxID=1337874 RepID=A0ABW2GUU7_9ACTN